MQYGTIICQNIPAFALTLPTPVFYTGYGTEVTRAGLSMLNGHVVLPTPDDILRIPQIVRDCYSYCQNDENFRTKAKI